MHYIKIYKNKPKKRGQNWITPPIHVYYMCGHKGSSESDPGRSLTRRPLPPPRKKERPKLDYSATDQCHMLVT
jgi:hypothetical protein